MATITLSLDAYEELLLLTMKNIRILSKTADDIKNIVLNARPFIPYHIVKQLKECKSRLGIGDTCSVCLTEGTFNFTNCGHIICEACVASLDMNGIHRCPVCRSHYHMCS